jgi:hypothetical protein
MQLALQFAFKLVSKAGGLLEHHHDLLLNCMELRREEFFRCEPSIAPSGAQRSRHPTVSITRCPNPRSNEGHVRF